MGVGGGGVTREKNVAGHGNAGGVLEGAAVVFGPRRMRYIKTEGKWTLVVRLLATAPFVS